MASLSPADCSKALALSWRQVLAMVPLGRRTIDRKIATGDFPKPVRVGGKMLFDAREVRWWWERTREGGSAANLTGASP